MGEFTIARSALERVENLAILRSLRHLTISMNLALMGAAIVYVVEGERQYRVETIFRD